MFFRTLRCTLADRLVLMAIASAYLHLPRASSVRTRTYACTDARPRTYACTDVRRRAPFRLTATLAQPLRVRRSPERSPRVSATLALRTHWFEQTNVRTHYVRMRFRTPRCTLADRLVLMAMAVAHHQKASRRELKHTCKRTYARRTSKMQASKLAVTVT